MVETTARDVDGKKFILSDPPKEDGDKATWTPRPVEPEIQVSTSSIRDAENTLIAEGKHQVSEFETFKQKILNEEKWVFLVSDPHDMDPVYHKGGHGKADFMGQVKPEGTYPDFTDPNPEQTQKTIDGQHSLLNACGGCIESIGHFTAMLNDTAQSYALADEHSFPPTNTAI
jgi:hypothetical protein